MEFESVQIPDVAGGPSSSANAAPGTSNTTTTGCASGGKAACTSLIIHAMASLPLSRNKDNDDLDAKNDG